MQKIFPRFFVFFLVLTLLTGKLTKATATVGQQFTMIFGTSGSVLGDDDSSENKEDDDEQEQEQEREQHDEDDDEQEQEQQQEREREQRDEDDDEQEQGESHTEETIRNANGTTTLIKRESDSEKTEVELKTYNASGKLIEERKLKQELENSETKEIELELEQYLTNNGVLQELKIKNSLGKELEITLREDGQNEQTEITSKVEYDPTEQELKITDEAQSRALVITPENDHFLLDDGVQSAEVGLPITINTATGEVFVETTVGLIRVAISPDKALEIIKDKDTDADLRVGSISLEEGGNGLEYRIKTERRERLFGLFPVTLDSVEGIDAEVGSLSTVQQDIVTRLLDMFSV